ncbi:hypothetical protein ACGFSB_04530 [Streptomyces sp. NPDC048441]|uniref:hypothetical protein n=1 Tax=Streptomyces sp. NPDC048441 TaxID=3365552 RepID=UPI003719B631
MTDDDSLAAAPSYTDAGRARVVMAYEAYELADLARAAVPIGGHELRSDGGVESPGSVLADAAHVLRAARRFFEAAVVFERLGGASWQRVGDVLGTEAATARVRFAMAEACFREQLRSPESVRADTGDGADGADGEMSWWRGHIPADPLETALDLDDWVLRHADGNDDLGTAPVSGGLARQEAPTRRLPPTRRGPDGSADAPPPRTAPRRTPGG